MDYTAYLVLMALMGTVCGSPTCPAECELVHKDKHTIHHSHFQHISKLNDSSVAPWNLTYDVTEGREPERIQQARCRHCTVEHMIAEPIVIQISVYQRIRNNTRDAWCKCPYKVAVGCTCVNKQQQ